MIKVYIASPYTVGNVDENVRKQIDCAEKLINLGYVPFVPLYYHFQNIVHPHNYETWLKLDLEWLKVCDCLLRLSGKSKGADREVQFAKDNNIPVFYSIEEINEWVINIQKDLSKIGNNYLS